MEEHEQTLDAELAKVRAIAAERWPDDLKERFRRAVAELERDVVAHSLDVGERAPDFALAEAASGEVVRLSERLARGPVVLSFYRGYW